MTFVPVAFTDSYCYACQWCTLHQFDDPRNIPNNNYWPLAHWFSAFIVFLFTHDYWKSFSFFFVWKVTRYVLMTIILWTRLNIPISGLIFSYNTVSDYFDAIITIMGTFVGFLVVNILDSPRLTRQPYKEFYRFKKEYDKDDNVFSGVAELRIKHYTRVDFIANWLKQYAYLILMQYPATVALWLPYFIEPDQSTVVRQYYDLSAYYVIELVVVILFAMYGYRNQLDQEIIWNYERWRFLLFVFMWAFSISVIVIPTLGVNYFIPQFTVAIVSTVYSIVLIGVLAGLKSYQFYETIRMTFAS